MKRIPFLETKFIYTKKDEEKFGKEVFDALQTNELIGVQDMFTHHTIVLKEPIYNFFQLQYYEPLIPENIIGNSTTYRRTSDDIFRYLNGQDESLSKENFLNSKENFNRANLVGKEKNIHFMRVLGNDFIHPEDIKKFSETFIGIPSRNFKDIHLKISDLPRLLDFSLLEYILTQTGTKEMSSDRLCYNLIYYKDTIALEKNASITLDNTLEKINEMDFKESILDFNKGCFPDNFIEGDKAIGMLSKGVYTLLNRNELIKLENEQGFLVQSYIKEYDITSITSRIVTSIKKYFDYPKKGPYLLVERESLDSIDKKREYDFRMFTQGFYNLVTSYKTLTTNRKGKKFLKNLVKNMEEVDILYSFRREVVKEFLLFIIVNYINISDVSDDVIRYTESIKDQIFSSNDEIKRDYFYYIITNLVKINDPDEAAVKLFSHPNLIYGDLEGNQYPLLRSISFFITCQKERGCQNIITASETDTKNLTFLNLLNQSNRGPFESFDVYYNVDLKMYTNFVIEP